ncbi:hypothetical protein AGR7C_Cc140004 [Agrobacterium deltaense Zutra 3/1]|uniref:Uncharacterized protein n=1 Tax=Agrobacterium deltaense Zutra 3/1 TaxID=1183427 RepID=A0A1S7PBG3_9HYPH|nr:hypothetical protein AGR7C_Cc140004 [Agrobacterium deltaense Zutra 3/1]
MSGVSLSTLPEQVCAVKVDVWAKPIPHGTRRRLSRPGPFIAPGTQSPASNPAIVLTQATNNENIK